MKIFKQLFIILGINVAGEVISRYLNLPLPGSITGMILLLVLLLTGVVKEHQIRETADFMLQNMGFFFIPAGVSILVSYQAFEGHYFQTILAIVISTILVLAITSLATQLLINFNEKKNGKNN